VPSIVAELKDATFVHSAYVAMLRTAPTSDAAHLIDGQLTASRKDYEETPFSELAARSGNAFSPRAGACSETLDHASLYLAILRQADRPDHDLTVVGPTVGSPRASGAKPIDLHVTSVHRDSSSLP
jgi:hypothetical protein